MGTISQAGKHRGRGAYLLASTDSLSTTSCVRNLEAGWQRQDLFCSCFSCSQQSADRSTLAVEAVEHLPPPLAAKNPLLQVAVDPHLGRRSSFQVKPSLPRRSCKGCRVNGRPWRQS